MSYGLGFFFFFQIPSRVELYVRLIAVNNFPNTRHGTPLLFVVRVCIWLGSSESALLGTTVRYKEQKDGWWNGGKTFSFFVYVICCVCHFMIYGHRLDELTTRMRSCSMASDCVTVLNTHTVGLMYFLALARECPCAKRNGKEGRKAHFLGN